MKKESDAILLRILISESDKYEGKPLSKYLIKFFKQEGLSGATTLRGISGFGKTSQLHITPFCDCLMTCRLQLKLSIEKKILNA